MASETNNFKLLEEETIKQNPRAISDIESAVKGQVRLYNLTGNTIELYLSRLMDLVISLLGGDPRKPEQDQTNDHKGDE